MVYEKLGLAVLGSWPMTVGLRLMPLNGQPGVISARYAGVECDDEANNDKVLREMIEVPHNQRSCRFRCVLALVGHEVEETFSGACEGMLPK